MDAYLAYQVLRKHVTSTTFGRALSVRQGQVKSSKGMFNQTSGGSPGEKAGRDLGIRWRTSVVPRSCSFRIDSAFLGKRPDIRTHDTLSRLFYIQFRRAFLISTTLSKMVAFSKVAAVLAAASSVSAHTIFQQLWVNGVAQGQNKGIRVPS